MIAFDTLSKATQLPSALVETCFEELKLSLKAFATN